MTRVTILSNVTVVYLGLCACTDPRTAHVFIPAYVQHRPCGRCEDDFRFIVPPGRLGGSVGRAVPEGSGGSVGVGNRVGGIRDHDLRRSPTLEISSEAGRTGSVGRTDPGRNRPRADGRVGRSGTINVKSTSHRPCNCNTGDKHRSGACVRMIP